MEKYKIIGGIFFIIGIILYCVLQFNFIPTKKYYVEQIMSFFIIIFMYTGLMTILYILSFDMNTL